MQWASFKATNRCPFGYLPLLELPSGCRLNETTAILNVIGRLAGMQGETEADFGMSSMLACKAGDMFAELVKVQPTMFNVKHWDEAKARALQEWLPKCAEYFEQLEALCAADGTFTQSGTTVGELALWSTLHQMNGAKLAVDLPPRLKTFFERVGALPAIQRCIAGETKMGELADYVVPVPPPEE